MSHIELVIGDFQKAGLRGRPQDEETTVGQKVHPLGFRLGDTHLEFDLVRRKRLCDLLHEDLKLRDYIKSACTIPGVARIDIERRAGRRSAHSYGARDW